jgi:AraC-like DNA-binding protein
MLGRADHTWRTHDVAAPDQFATWERIATRAFAPVSLSRSPGDEGEDGFLTACSTRAVDDLGIAWLDSGAQLVSHTTRHIDAGPPGVYFVNLPLAGEGMALQDGRISVTGPGDFVLVNGDRPFTLACGGRFQQLAVAIPRHRLDPLLADPSQSNCVLVKGDAGAGAMASSAIQSLAAQRCRLTPREAHGIANILVELVSLAVSAAVEQGDAPLRLRRYQAVLDEVERRLCDAELRPQDVARELSISVSYLTKLFSDHGTSFGRTVLTRRLERARSLLAADLAKSGRAMTVTEVAHACGFSDSGYFSRVFRTRFGITPSEFRATAGQRERPAYTTSVGRTP